MSTVSVDVSSIEALGRGKLHLFSVVCSVLFLSTASMMLSYELNASGDKTVSDQKPSYWTGVSYSFTMLAAAAVGFLLYAYLRHFQATGSVLD